MNSISQFDYEGEFQRAWADSSNTQFELPPVDINRVLAEYYRTSEPLTFTSPKGPRTGWSNYSHSWGMTCGCPSSSKSTSKVN